MKLIVIDGVPVIELASGIRLDIHGPEEALSITHDGQTVDVTMDEQPVYRLVFDGFNFQRLIEAEFRSRHPIATESGADAAPAKGPDATPYILAHPQEFPAEAVELARKRAQYLPLSSEQH